MPLMRLSFFIPGHPAPGGSKKFVGIGRHTGRAILVDAGGQRNKDWRAAVSWAAHEHYRGELLAGPLEVTFTFYLPRPKGHHGRQGLRRTAPPYPITRPDALKLARSTEDALTGVIWRDDAQVVNGGQRKRYAEGSGVGCLVEIVELVPDLDPVPERNTKRGLDQDWELDSDQELLPGVLPEAVKARVPTGVPGAGFKESRK